MDHMSTPRVATQQMADATPTTDFAMFESQKENIRPLASGRSAATLSSLFEKNEAEKVIQDGHVQHRNDIEEAERRDREGEEMADGFMDLLDVYNKYILFTVQHHPTSASHLVPLLESTSRRFIDDARYSQDIRNLKMWVMYTRHVERREEIFAYLESKDVGTKHALFYEEWATAVEGLGRKKKADEIYKLGINRRAAPVERLRTRHQAFLARIMAPPGGQIPDDDPVSSSSRPSSRSILGQVASTPTSSLSGATQLAPSTRVSRPNNGSRMEVFTDSGAVAQDEPAGDWADFGTRDGRRKENVIEATPWKGETLPQKRVAPRTPKMEVFKDSTDNEAVRATPADEVFGRRAQNSEAEQLKMDPLRNFDTSAMSNSLPVLPPPPSVRKAPRPKSHYVMQPWECPQDGPEVKDVKGKIQRRMFDWNATFKNGEEWSFEEVRARERGLLGKEWRGEVKEWERSWHAPGSSTPRQEEKKRKPPSPTVNTKLANEEVAMMFDQTIHGRARESDSESDDESGSSDGEEEAVAIPPTPLPAPGGMMRPVAGMVPPTPTPAQGLGRPAPMAVFADENASVPQSAKKFNIFSETPAKTPLAARTPVASSSKSRAFGVFTEDENADDYVQATPSLKPRAPLGSVNVFATPAVGEKMPARRALAMVIPEEAEEVDEQIGSEEAGEVVEEFININDEEDDEEPAFQRRGVSRPGMLTPIVERTCEYTSVSQMSALRSSTSNATSSRRISSASLANGVIDEEDEQVLGSASQPALTGLDAVAEEDERSGSLPAPSDDSSPRTSLGSMFQSPAGNHSGRAGPGFALPEGFTIHAQPAPAMVDENNTRHRECSMERDDEFVTAEHGPGDFVTAEQSRAGLPNPCNPIDEEVIAELLATMDPPLSSVAGFVDYRSSAFNRLDALQKHSKIKVRRNSGAGRRVSIAPEEGYALTLVDKEFEVRDKIGEGGFGAVFLGVDVQMRQALDERDDDEEDSDEEDEEAENKCLVAIKVERPAAVWEGIVLDRLHQRLDEEIRQSIIRSRSLYAFADESYLLLDFSAQGTLLDVVNKATSMGIAPATAGAQSSLDELVAVFFTTELLRTVEALHRASFIHGDLKIDNCLVRLEETPNSAWSNAYDRSGGSGWSKKGVKMIDFGRAIDLSLFPDNGRSQKFVADWKMDERDCVEMREGKEWSYETDYWGLASIAYCMLFGKYIGTETVGGRYKIDQPLRRYWQADLWNALFDLLLNPKDIRGELPVTDELAEVRGKFENWLEENCQKGGKNLKSMLKKIELAAITSARRA